MIRVDTTDFEATQGHEPQGVGEWGFVFYDSEGFEYGSFMFVGEFAEAKAEAEQLAKVAGFQGAVTRHEVTVIKVVA